MYFRRCCLNIDVKTENMTVIETIKEKRDSLNLPLRKVAAAADVDTSTWSKIEKEERALRPEMLEGICSLLELDIKEITVQFWSDKLQKELADQEFSADILKETTKKLRNSK